MDLSLETLFAYKWIWVIFLHGQEVVETYSFHTEIVLLLQKVESLLSEEIQDETYTACSRDPMVFLCRILPCKAVQLHWQGSTTILSSFFLLVQKTPCTDGVQKCRSMIARGYINIFSRWTFNVDIADLLESTVQLTKFIIVNSASKGPDCIVCPRGEKSNSR